MKILMSSYLLMILMVLIMSRFKIEVNRMVLPNLSSEERLEKQRNRKRELKENYLRHKKRLATDKDICPYAKRHCQRMIEAYELKNKKGV